MSVAYSKYFFDEMAETNLNSARAVLPFVFEFVNPKSVVDIGCGQGLWLKAFMEKGINDVVGYDGNYVEKKELFFPEKLFTAADLEKPLAFKRRFDLAVCLEVAEHLPVGVADTLVETLTKAAPVVLFSAAIPLQGGSHHINEQWPEYWEKKFALHGYVPVDALRRQIWGNKNIAFYYQQNVLFYVRKDSLSDYPKFQKEIDCGHNHALPIVHPYMYLYYAERWRLVVPILGKIPPGVLHSIKKFLKKIMQRR